MQGTEIPACCALQVIHGLDCLYAEDEYSKQEAAELPSFIKHQEYIKGAHGGAYIMASIALISPAVGRPEFKKQQDALRKAGMHLICRFPGEHKSSYGNYKIEMWGTENMEAPKASRVKKSPRSKRG